jgi:outer membrane protein assembly factor BamB
MSRSATLLGCWFLIVGLVAGCDTKPAASGANSTSSSTSAMATASNNTGDSNSVTSTDSNSSTSPPARSQQTPETSQAPAKLEVDPMDWPNWRGPEQNRVSRETGLIDHWDPETKENVLWTNPDGASISSPIVMHGKVYSIGRYKPGTRNEQEQIVCIDAESGKTLWRSRHNMYLAGVPAERIGWASVVGDPTTGRVYSYGTNGLLECLDSDSGKTIWSRSLPEEFGFLTVYGGRTNFPVVFDDLVIISAVDTGWGDRAPPAHRFMAFDKNTGEVRWFNSGTTPLPEDTTYSTPTLAVLDGQMQLIEGSSDGAVWAFQPRTGQPLWHYRMSPRGLNVSPLVVGDTIFMGQSEENLDSNSQGMLLAFKGGGTGDTTGKADLWKLRGVMEGKSSPILVDGHIYAADDGGNLYIVDAAKGKLVKKVKLLGTIVRGTPLYADGKIYLCTATGWHCLKPTESGVEVIQKFRLAEEDNVIGSPVVSHGRIYLPTGSQLYCLGKKDQKPAATAMPAPSAEEQPVAKDDKPVQVQVVPGDVLVKSGDKQQFRVRLFNDRGRFLREESEAKFSLDGPGQVDKAGVYQAADDKAHTATILTATVGDVSGQARIRVVPALPWKFDFQKIPLTANPKTKVMEGQPPITWVGLRYRHVIRELDGRKVMVKINTIPKGTHSQGWMGPNDLHDYTIQADVRAATNNESAPESGTPDVGLTAQRYSLMLMGVDQQLRIIYWPPQVATQFSKIIPFTWKPNVWYTMKLQASTDGDKAVLRGKVWPRDEKEPAAWTIEVADDMPNLQGSPGLVGDTTNKGEFYMDNIQVYPNSDAAKTADAK